jgi:glycosyltransferase involved in cell wall biosynthesis
VKVLFITWDGPQVTYLQGLFLPIFERLHSAGFTFHVLQFTWGDESLAEGNRKACEVLGINYRSVRVLRYPIGGGALLTALFGARIIRKVVSEWSIDVLMPRSNLPAAACLVALPRLDLPVVFDADGLPLDERVDFAGANASSLSHRVLRDIEAQMVRRADIVLTRTRRAVDILLARGGAGTEQEKFHVVSNGRDANRFRVQNSATRRAVRSELCVSPTAPLLVYVGSLGAQYCLAEMIQLFDAVIERRADSRFLILTGSPEVARAALSRRPDIEEATILKQVPSREVPRYLACADLGIALRQQSFSMQAVAPIKMAEYLLCGLPVVATKGIGDTDTIESGVGFLIEQNDRKEIEAAGDWFCSQVLHDRDGFAKRCREVACKAFSLEVCTNEYLSALRSLVK